MEVDVMFAGGGFAASVWSEQGVVVRSLWETGTRERKILAKIKPTFFDEAVLQGDVAGYKHSRRRGIQDSPPCVGITSEGKKQGCDQGPTRAYREVGRSVKDAHEEGRSIPFISTETVFQARYAWRGEPCMLHKMCEQILPYGYNVVWRTLSSRSFSCLDRTRMYILFTPVEGLDARPVLWSKPVANPPKVEGGTDLLIVDTRRSRFHEGGELRHVCRRSDVYVSKPGGSRPGNPGEWRRLGPK